MDFLAVIIAIGVFALLVLMVEGVDRI